jgi:homocysteine S-methyltransferase
MRNPLSSMLEEQSVLLLDGAMATELERRGADLRDVLWSAKVLMESPALIQQVHYDYFVAGADVATSASYQATFAGFAQRGLTHDEAARLMRLSVELAMAARDEFWRVAEDRARGQGMGRQGVARQRPLVVASVGPYGAYLANGAEYTGDYRLSLQGLMDFHGPRLEVLAKSGADLLACETIPSLLEVEALVQLLQEYPHVQAWVSCSCGDEANLWHGEPLRAVVELANACEQVVAVGVNCTAPDLVGPLLMSVRNYSTKPLLAYPNRGESWDAVAHCWVPDTGVTNFAGLAQRWYEAGARLIGGCCRTTPEDITAMAASLPRVFHGLE